MKKILKLFSPMLASVLSLVIVSIANSSSCYYFHQPMEPRDIDEYKWIK